MGVRNRENGKRKDNQQSSGWMAFFHHGRAQNILVLCILIGILYQILSSWYWMVAIKSDGNMHDSSLLSSLSTFKLSRASFGEQPTRLEQEQFQPEQHPGEAVKELKSLYGRTKNNKAGLSTQLLGDGAPPPRGGLDSVGFVIGVLSARENFERRQRIRKLWKDELANSTSFAGNNRRSRGHLSAARAILPVFIVGAGFCDIPREMRTHWYKCDRKETSFSNATATLIEQEHLRKQRNLTDRLYQEASIHGDMLLVNIDDFYHNSPRKIATYLAWVAKKTSAHYLMKMDDDVFLDWRLFQKRMIHTIATKRLRVNEVDRLFWWGNLRVNNDVYRSGSAADGRWDIKEEDWPSGFWPLYMSGVGSVLDINSAHFITDNFDILHHRLFGEDVALGVWLSSTDIKYVHDVDTFPKSPSEDSCKRSQALLFFDECQEEVQYRLFNNKKLGESDILEASPNDASDVAANDPDASANVVEESVPSTCGVYYFYHNTKVLGVGRTNSIVAWLKVLATFYPSRINFLPWFEIGSERSTDQSWNQGLLTMQNTIESGKLSSKKDGGLQWLFVQHHHQSPGLRFMMPIFTKWRRTLKAQGCELILATVLREPKTRMKSFLSTYQVQQKDLIPFVKQDIEGQARYLLFNSCEKHQHPNVPPAWCGPPENMGGNILTREEIDEVVGYLKHFDIVGRSDRLTKFHNESSIKTGWPFYGYLPDEDEVNLHYVINDDHMWEIEKSVRTDLQLWERIFGE